MKNKTCGECKYFNCLAHGFCKNKQGRLSVQVNDPICQNYNPKPIKPTNGDRIRSMSDESLAEVLMDLYDGNKCKYCAYMKSGMCSLKPRHEEYDEGGWVEDEDCIRGMIEYLKKEVENE